MANKQASADHLLTSSNPTFQTRAELEAWVVETARAAGADKQARLKALDLIYTVTLAHLHLPEGDNA
jgi:hypothetical protein